MNITVSDAIMARMQALRQAVQGGATDAASAPSASGGAPPLDFGAMLRDAVRGVNAVQNGAQAKAQALQLGERGVSIEEVMISMQQAGLRFQGMVAVRNKLLEAYREISSMQV